MPAYAAPPETPCSERMLPDQTRAYFLAIETPFEVDFAYPGLSPWNEDIANPYASTVGGPTSTMPATLIVSDMTKGYEFHTILTDLGDIWAPRMITGLNPIIMPGGVITPGSVEDIGSRIACTWSTSRTLRVSTSTIDRTTTITPAEDSVDHPSYWNVRSSTTRHADVTMGITYQVDTPDLITPNWNSASTNYSITVEFQVSEVTNAGLAYRKPVATSIPFYTYGSEELQTVPITGVPAPVWIPYAYASRTYRYTTNNRASFMAATTFELTPVTPTTQPQITGLGGLSTVYDLTDKTTPKAANDAVFAVWGGGLGWTTYAASGSSKTLFSSGNMSTGWPAKLIVSRTPFT